MTEASRYNGKPFLRLLELYVLWAIGEIGDVEERKLEDMTPKLRSIYKMEGSWQEIIASTMHFPADLPAALQNMWKKNNEIAVANGVRLSPQQFAEMVVDENFAPGP